MTSYSGLLTGKQNGSLLFQERMFQLEDKSLPQKLTEISRISLLFTNKKRKKKEISVLSCFYGYTTKNRINML